MSPSAVTTLRYKTLKDFGRILNLFESGGAEEKGVSEVSKALQILPSKVSRMMRTLEAEGLFMRNPENGKYRIGARFLQLGLLYVFKHPLRQIILPHLEQIVEDLNMTTGWGIFENSQVTVVDRLNVGKKSFIRHLGSNIPLHSTAYGKLFLAYLPEQEREQLIATLFFTKFTATTICDVNRFREELESVKKQGHAVDRGETSEDITAIGTPILDQKGDAVAVMSISTETPLVTPEGLEGIIQYLVERTAFISRQIGYDKHAVS